MMCVSSQITRERLQALESIFAEADVDRGGHLDRDEFRRAVRCTMGAHLTDMEIDAIFMKVRRECILWMLIAIAASS